MEEAEEKIDEEEESEKAGAWITGQRLTRQKFNPEAYREYWNKKNKLKEEEKESEK